MTKRFHLLLILAAGLASAPVQGQPAAIPARATPQSASAAAMLTYADLADLTLAAPVLVRATITKATRVAEKNSPGLAPGRARLLVTAQVNAALLAPGALPASLTWLWDAPLDARGKAPKAKGMAVIAWTGPVQADGSTRLISARAQQLHTPELEARVRAIATAAVKGDVPAFTGVSNGFRAEGTVPGESESQFFLTTKDNSSATLIVQSRPGEARRVFVSRGEIIDESAARVQPESLLWYRLACFLPGRLPASAGGDDRALAADWQAALASLGHCARTK
jgi:hypothetical protein